MVKSRRKVNRKLLYFGMLVIISLASLFMLFSISLLDGIENKVRILLSINLIIIVGFCYFLSHVFTTRHKKLHLGFFIFGMIYSCIMGVGAHYIYKTYKVIDTITTSSTSYASSLVSLKKKNADSIDDVTSGTIGYLADENSIDGNQIPQEIIKEKKLKNKTKEYDSYEELIEALLDNDVEYIFLPSNYALMFANVDKDGFDTLEEDTKVLYTKEKEVKQTSSKANGALTEPFSVLIMGVDDDASSIKGSSFNGDALMLLTFNPTTLNTTILSIPRDSYVPIACFTGKRKSKITSAAWYGTDCMMDTIEDFLDIEIDYYVKINFKGVISLIDTLGGVEVDVPYSFCEQDSNRKWGKNTIYVEKGLRTLNGEEALALSRNRKANTRKCSSKWTHGVRNDFVRGQNQQLVLRAMLNKMKSINDLDTIYSLLNTISKNMETDMSTSEILSLYNVGKDIIVQANDSKMEDLLGFQRLYLNGKDVYLYDTKAGKNLYNYVLYDSSVAAVSNAMKVNLDVRRPIMEKEFSFDANEAYEEEVIGKTVK